MDLLLGALLVWLLAKARRSSAVPFLDCCVMAIGQRPHGWCLDVFVSCCDWDGALALMIESRLSWAEDEIHLPLHR